MHIVVWVWPLLLFWMICQVDPTSFIEPKINGHKTRFSSLMYTQPRNSPWSSYFLRFYNWCADQLSASKLHQMMVHNFWYHNNHQFVQKSLKFFYDLEELKLIPLFLTFVPLMHCRTTGVISFCVDCLHRQVFVILRSWYKVPSAISCSSRLLLLQWCLHAVFFDTLKW